MSHTTTMLSKLQDRVKRLERDSEEQTRRIKTLHIESRRYLIGNSKESTTVMTLGNETKDENRKVVSSIRQMSKNEYEYKMGDDFGIEKTRLSDFLKENERTLDANSNRLLQSLVEDKKIPPRLYGWAAHLWDLEYAIRTIHFTGASTLAIMYALQFIRKFGGSLVTTGLLALDFDQIILTVDVIKFLIKMFEEPPNGFQYHLAIGKLYFEGASSTNQMYMDYQNDTGKKLETDNMKLESHLMNLFDIVLQGEFLTRVVLRDHFDYVLQSLKEYRTKKLELEIYHNIYNIYFDRELFVDLIIQKPVRWVVNTESTSPWSPLAEVYLLYCKKRVDMIRRARIKEQVHKVFTTYFKGQNLLSYNSQKTKLGEELAKIFDSIPTARGGVFPLLSECKVVERRTHDHYSMDTIIDYILHEEMQQYVPDWYEALELVQSYDLPVPYNRNIGLGDDLEGHFRIERESFDMSEVYRGKIF